MEVDNQYTDMVLEDGYNTGNELNYANQLSAQITRINYFMSRLNETPSWVFVAWSRSDNNFNPLNYKPNIDNFIKSVKCLEILLTPKVDKEYSKWEKDAVKPEKEGNYNFSIKKYKKLIELIYRNDLLPSDRKFK